MPAIPIYSSELVAINDDTGEFSLEIPAGVVCVARDIDATVGIQDGTEVWAYDGAGVVFWGVKFGLTTADFNTLSWRGRQVIAGPSFVYISSSANCWARMSGYLLNAP